MCAQEEEVRGQLTDFVRMRTLIKQEERYRWAIEKQMAKATKITATISKTGGCGGSRGTGSQVEDSAVILAELQEQYSEIMEQLNTERDELRKSLSKIRSQRLRLEKTCLRMRYIQGISVRRIAEALNYSEDYIHKRMRNAEALIINKQRASEGEKKKTDQDGDFMIK